jgi:hypothetical protein
MKWHVYSCNKSILLYNADIKSLILVHSIEVKHVRLYILYDLIYYCNIVKLYILKLVILNRKPRILLYFPITINHLLNKQVYQVFKLLYMMHYHMVISTVYLILNTDR